MQTFANGVAVHWGGEGLLVGVGPLFWGDRNASELGEGGDHAPSQMCIKLLSCTSK